MILFVYTCILSLLCTFTARRYSAVFAVVRCPSVRLSVTLTYCIHAAENIVKLLSQPGSLIILVFDPKRRYPNPTGTHLTGAQSTRLL